MEPVSDPSPDLATALLQLARALLVAVRSWTLYPPGHPTVDVSVRRLVEAIGHPTFGGLFAIGVTPDTLVFGGTPADSAQEGIREAAALLHGCDLLSVTFAANVPREAVLALLRFLALDPAERRNMGGPAAIWRSHGHPAIALEQLDYEKILASERDQVNEPAKRDDLWRSIVTSIAGGQRSVFDERAQGRLLAIAGSPTSVADLVTAATAAHCTPDGSPMITLQAATVLAAFRKLAETVSVKESERLPDVLDHVATVAMQLDPHILVQLMLLDDHSDGTAIAEAVGSKLDDATCARLLAATIAPEDRSTERLARVLNLVAPDINRKRRLLSLARDLLRDTDFGRSPRFETFWALAEEMLVSYNDAPFVSTPYRATLQGVDARANRMAADLPGELSTWMETVQPDNVRSLSVLLLIDLLTLETDQVRANTLVHHMQTLAEDLLNAGAYDDVRRVLQTIRDSGDTPGTIGRVACQEALGQLGESLAMRETVSLAGEVDEPEWQKIRSLLPIVGPSSVEALKPLLMVEAETVARRRAEEAVVGFGAPAGARLGSLVADPRWFVAENAARLLGRVGSADAVPLLRPLLRHNDPRVVGAAVSALAGIEDISAARAVHTVLRSATGAARQAVVNALVAGRDPRVVPTLATIVAESDALGRDYDIVREALGALGMVGSDRALPTLVAMARRRSWIRRKKLRAIKESSVDALLQIGGSSAAQALKEAVQNGDRLLKKIVALRRDHPRMSVGHA